MFVRFLQRSSLVIALFASTIAYARPLKIGTFPWIGFAPLQVAAGKGFWKQTGVDVQVISYPSDAEALAAFKQKKIDLMTTMVGNIYGYRQAGIPMYLMAETGWSHGSDKLIAKQNLSANKLKGATVGVYLRNATIGNFLNQYLASQKLKPTDVKLEEATPEKLTNDFASGKYPLIVTYDPFALDARRKGAGDEVGNSASWPGILPEGIVGQPNLTAEFSNDQLANFFTGWLESIRWIDTQAKWKEIFPLLRKGSSPTPESLDELDVIAMLNSYRFHLPSRLIQRNEAGGGTQKYLKQVQQYLADTQSPAAQLSPEQLVSVDAALKAAQRALAAKN